MSTYARRACPLFGEGAERARYSSRDHDGCVWRQSRVVVVPAGLMAQQQTDMALRFKPPRKAAAGNRPVLASGCACSNHTSPTHFGLGLLKLGAYECFIHHSRHAAVDENTSPTLLVPTLSRRDVVTRSCTALAVASPSRYAHAFTDTTIVIQIGRTIVWLRFVLDFSPHVLFPAVSVLIFFVS